MYASRPDSAAAAAPASDRPAESVHGPQTDPEPAHPPCVPRRGDAFLYWWMVALLMLIGWGKMDVYLASWFHFSVGGSASGVFRLLVVGYLATRIYNRDVALRFGWVHDPLVWLYLLAAISPLWVLQDPAWPAEAKARAPAHDTAQLFSTVLPGLMSYLATRYLLDRGFDGYGFPVLRAVTVALSLVSVQILTAKPNVLLDFSQVDSLYEHHTHVAMRMVAAIPLTIGFLMYDHARSVAAGRMYAVLLLFQIVGITIANSRIGWMALGAVGVYGVFYGASPKMRRAFLYAMLIAMALTFSFPRVRNNFLTLLHLTQQDNFKNRVVVYTTDLKLIAANPVLGLGFSNRNFLYSGRAMEGQNWDFEHPHDLFLQIPVYLGIPGLLLLLWLIVTLWRSASAICGRAPPDQAPVASGARGALLGLLVMNIAETALSSERLAFMLPILLACVVSWARQLKD